MKIAPSRQYILSLESVAMTDIIMNMFIFFFISFSLLYTFSPLQVKHIKINLPKAKNVQMPDERVDVVSITLTSEGPLYLEGQLVTLKELSEKLGVLAKENPELSVIFRVDRLVPFKSVVNVLDILNEAEISRLRIAAEEEK